MGERLSLQVALEGAEQVISQLKSIDKIANKEDKRKIKLQIDTAKNNLAKVGTQLKQQQNIFNRISSRAPHFADQYRSKLRDIGKEMKPIYREMGEINHMMRNPHFGVISNEGKQALQGRMQYLRQYADSLKETARHYHAMEKGWREYGSPSYRKERNGAYNFDKQLIAREQERLTQAGKGLSVKVNPEVDSRRLQGQLSSHEYEVPVRAKLMEVYNKWSGTVSRFGSSMITLGNTLQTITSPFDSILRGAMYGIGYGALGKVTEGLASSTSRYDTLKTYPKIMESLGFSSTKAEKSVDKLNESVLGLPTGLDEIVDMAKRYALATHDIEEGTDVAIAANNAFLASAATDQQKYQGMMQLNDVLSGKKLQSREWMSLAASMPAAMQEIGKLLGYTKNSEFLQALYGNKIDNKKFIKALKEVGNEGGKIAEMAEISKQTFAGLASNVKNAFSRGGYKLLDALDNILIKTTGEGTVGNLKKITDGIDGIFDNAKKWMEAHPEEIMKFFDGLKNYDWQGLISGFGTALKDVTTFMGGFIKMLSGADASKIGKFLVYGNIIGKGLTIFGGALKGLAPVFGGAGVLSAITGKGGFFSAFRKLGKAKDVVDGAETVAEVGTAASKMAITWQGVASKAIGIAALPAAAGSMLMAAKALQEFDKVNLSGDLAKKVIAGMGAVAAFIGEAAVIGGALASNPIGWITSVGSAIGGGAMAAAAGEMVLIAKALNGIATAKIPSSQKVDEVLGSIRDLADQLQEVNLPMVKKGSGDNAKGIAGVLEGIASMLTNTKAISEIEIGKKQIKQAKKSISEIRPMIEEMKEEIAQLYGDESFNTRTNHRGQKVETTHRNKFDSKALENAQTDTGGVNSVLGNVLSFIGSMKKLSKKAEELKSLDIPALTDTIGTSISDMGTIAERIKQQSERLDGIKDAPERFTAMLTSIGSIKKILTKLQEMDESGIMASSTNRMLTLGNIIEQMSSALSKAGGGMINAAMFESMTASVKKGINNLNKINEVKIDFGGFEQTVASAVKVVKNATKKISKAWGNFKSATDEIKNISKTIFVAVHINGVDTAVAQMNSAASRLNAARANLNSAMNGGGGGGGGTVNPVLHTGGYLDGRGRVLYRASGGGVPLFKRKGMDTVPAMLTPGEYVNRRAAVAHFGVGFFERLNHLDLEGALRNISTRASRFAGGNTYNITNKTNNARVVQHIHTHDTNYAFKRANRFVEAL